MLPKSLRPLFPYLKKYRGSYFAGTVCVFFNNGVWILFPLVIRRAVDDLQAGVTREKLLTYSLLICWQWRRSRASSSSSPAGS